MLGRVAIIKIFLAAISPREISYDGCLYIFSYFLYLQDPISSEYRQEKYEKRNGKAENICAIPYVYSLPHISVRCTLILGLSTYSQY